MKKSTLCCLFFAAGALTGFPVAVYADGANDAQQLATLKQIKQQGLEARLNMLQQERACVQAAPTMEALHSCEQMSRQMMERMQEQQKASWESLKAASQQDNESKKQ